MNKIIFNTTKCLSTYGAQTEVYKFVAEPMLVESAKKSFTEFGDEPEYNNEYQAKSEMTTEVISLFF